VLPEYFDFYVRTRVVAGPGLSSQFGNELTRFKASRAFIVTDKVVGRLGFLERIRESLSGGGLEVAGVFDDVPPNSEFGVVTRGAEAYRAAGADLLLAIEAVFRAAGKPLPINVDGAIAAILVALGVDPRLSNAFFIMARVPGMVAHVHEEWQRQRPMRPVHPTDHEYDGPPDRSL